MENDTTHDTISHLVIPRAQHRSGVLVTSLLTAIGAVVILGIPILLSIWRVGQTKLPAASNPSQSAGGGQPRAFSEEAFKRGWYWGIKDKDSGTPADWVLTQNETEYCWHKPAVSCP